MLTPATVGNHHCSLTSPNTASAALCLALAPRLGRGRHVKSTTFASVVITRKASSGQVDYHPEWGILALGESSGCTPRLLAVATAIGAVIGGGIAFSMTRPLEDARLPVPGAINTRSTETSDRFQQPPEHQPQRRRSPHRCQQSPNESRRDTQSRKRLSQRLGRN